MENILSKLDKNSLKYMLFLPHHLPSELNYLDQYSVVPTPKTALQHVTEDQLVTQNNEQLVTQNNEQLVKSDNEQEIPQIQLLNTLRAIGMNIKGSAISKEYLTTGVPKTAKEHIHFRLSKLCVKPTDDGYWIWFGNYAGEVPRMGQHSARAILYKKLVEPISIGTRLTRDAKNSFAFDVNPFRCSRIADKVTLEDKMSGYASMMGEESITEALKPSEKVELENELSRCLKDIEDTYHPAFGFTYSDLFKEISDLGYTDFIVTQAMQKWGKIQP